MKKSFTIIEVLISLSIISIALPIISAYPQRILKKELDFWKELEMEKVKDLCFTRVVENFKPIEGEIDLGLYQIDLEPLTTFDLSCKAKITKEKELAVSELFKCIIYIEDKEENSSTYFVLINKSDTI